MTKADIVNEISKQTGIDRSDVLASIEAFCSVIKTSMAEGQSVYIRGFGSFVNKKRAQKKARNISKNETFIIPSHYIPFFKPSDIFKDKIKNSEKLKNE